MTPEESVLSGGKLAAALAKAQGEMAGAKKDSANPFFGSTYADLASVWDACRGPLSKNGLAIMQKPTCRFIGEPQPYSWKTKAGEERHGVHMATEVVVLTVLAHESGEREESAVSCILPDADPQAVGSAITYLRRYGLQAMVGIAPEDDDGEAANGRETPAGKKPTAVKGPVDEALASEVMAAAKELATKTKKDVADVLRSLSSFESKDGKQVPGFTDPFKVTSTKWLNGTLHHLRDALAKAELGVGDEDVLR
jgi:hypothetical protein